MLHLEPLQFDKCIEAIMRFGCSCVDVVLAVLYKNLLSLC